MIECVPNFSEGRDPEIIHGIQKALQSDCRSRVLHVDAGFDANRTVFTVVGTAESLENSILSAVDYCVENTSMKHQTGAHPRMGMLDVCPFIPISGSSMRDCVHLAYKVGKKLEKKGISGYFYQMAARQSQKKDLSVFREGGYEGIQLNLKEGLRKPDFGPLIWNPLMEKMGMTVLGARPVLIAYNLNLDTSSVKKAKRIASMIRENGKAESNFRLPGIKAIGWMMEKYGFAQVSTNITSYEKSSLYDVWKAVEWLARESNCNLTGSELVGLVPKEALLTAGKKFNEDIILTEDEYCHHAVQKLGLDQLAPFDINERILEYRIASLQ